MCLRLSLINWCYTTFIFDSNLDGAASPKEDDAPDDWAEKADENGSTPSDDGGGGTPNSEEMDTDDQQVVVKEKPKKTVVKPPTPKVRKDHLNIVFIGHVGKMLDC